MPLTTTKKKFYSPWCSQTLALIEKNGLNPTSFADLVGDLQPNIHGYLNGGIRPKIAKLDHWAKKLHLSQAEFREWKRAAIFAHAPLLLKDEVELLNREHKELMATYEDIIAQFARLNAQCEDLTRTVEIARNILRKKGLEPHDFGL